MILYPKNWVEPEPQAKPVQSKTAAKDLIRAMARDVPVKYADLIAAVKASEQAAGRFWRRAEIREMIEEVDANWHPVAAVTP